MIYQIMYVYYISLVRFIPRVDHHSVPWCAGMRWTERGLLALSKNWIRVFNKKWLHIIASLFAKGMADRISAHMWNRMSDRMPDGIFEYIYIYMPDRLSADHPKKIIRVSVRNHPKSFLFVGKCWICWRQTNIVRKNNQSIKISTAWMLFKTGFFHCQLPCWMTVGANMLRTNDFVSFIST